MSRKRIKFRNAVSNRTISINHPNITIWTTQFCSQCKTSTNTQCTKSARVQPFQRTSWSKKSNIALRTYRMTFLHGKISGKLRSHINLYSNKYHFTKMQTFIAKKSLFIIAFYHYFKTNIILFPIAKIFFYTNSSSAYLILFT